MDDHQRRVWAEMLRQIDDWEQGRIGLPRLVEALYGLLELLPGTTWITGKASEMGG
jgi:hypothetical protein